MTPPTRSLAAVAAVAFSLVALSGCLEDAAADPDAPEAILTASKTTAMASEAVTFDAQSSRDPNGAIAVYRFDFGDGTTLNVTSEEEARVEHAYERGGVYEATVEVVDDGSGQDRNLSDEARLTVVVHEAFPVAPALLTIVPANGTEEVRRPFEVHDDASLVNGTLSFTSAVPLGDSTVTLRVEDADGAILREENVTVGAGRTVEATFEVAPGGPGGHVLVLAAQSGAVEASGELVVRYGDAADPDAADA